MKQKRFQFLLDRDGGVAVGTALEPLPTNQNIPSFPFFSMDRLSSSGVPLFPSPCPPPATHPWFPPLATLPGSVLDEARHPACC